MQQADELQDIIQQSIEAFKQIPETIWIAKPEANKWSKQEILGHLIDSAMNNMRRLIVSQFKQNQKMIYYQDQWIEAQNYQQAHYQELIALWKLLNQQMVRVMNNVPESKLHNTCDTGKGTVAYHTLEYIITDYIAHLKHHLSQITVR